MRRRLHGRWIGLAAAGLLAGTLGATPAARAGSGGEAEDAPRQAAEDVSGGLEALNPSGAPSGSGSSVGRYQDTLRQGSRDLGAQVGELLSPRRVPGHEPGREPEGSREPETGREPDASASRGDAAPTPSADAPPEGLGQTLRDISNLGSGSHPPRSSETPGTSVPRQRDTRSGEER